MIIAFPLATALVLLVAGISKLPQPDDLREAATNFRVPAILRTRLAARSLIAAEIALGIALVTLPPGWFVSAAVIVTALFAGFVVVAVAAVVRGDSFACGCFGALAPARVGVAMVVRNGVFLGLSVGAVAFGVWGPASVPRAVTALSPSDAGWLVLVGSGIAIAALLGWASRRDAARHVGASGSATVASLQVLGIGQVELVGADGSIASLSDLARTRPQLVLFVRPGCRSCESLLDVVPEIAASLAPVVDVIVAVDGHPGTYFPAREGLRQNSFFAVKSAKAVLGISQTPSAVVVGVGAHVQAGPAAGQTGINALLEGLSGTYTPGGMRI